MLQDEQLSNARLLVYANKQDLPGSMSVQEITQKLGLSKLRNRMWQVQGCSAPSGDGLYEGLDWLSSALTKNVMKQSFANAA